MRTIDDTPNGIVINHSSDWSGDVRIFWFNPSETREPRQSGRECWCEGRDLIAGRFVFAERPLGEGGAGIMPPVDILTRVVALAVEGYLRHKMEKAVDDLFIDRGKLRAR